MPFLNCCSKPGSEAACPSLVLFHTLIAAIQPSEFFTVSFIWCKADLLEPSQNTATGWRSLTENKLLVHTFHSLSQSPPNFSVPNERCHHLTAWQMAPFPKWSLEKVKLTSSEAFICPVYFMGTQGQSLNSNIKDWGRKQWSWSWGCRGWWGGGGGVFNFQSKIAKTSLTIFSWKNTEKLTMSRLRSPSLYLLSDSQAIPFCITKPAASFPWARSSLDSQGRQRL